MAMGWFTVGPACRWSPVPSLWPWASNDGRAFAHRHPFQAHQAHALARVRRRRGGFRWRRRRGSRRRARRRGGAPSGWPRSGRPRWGWWWRRCRGRTGTGRLPGAACRARPGRPGAPRPGQQRLGQRHRLFGRHRDLEAVFAGVTRARDEAGGRRPVEHAAAHEHQRGHAGFSRASASTACGPCSASSARSGIGTTWQRWPMWVCRWRVGGLAAGVDHQEQVAKVACAAASGRTIIRSSSRPPLALVKKA
jgi:hypothetical protein